MFSQLAGGGDRTVGEGETSKGSMAVARSADNQARAPVVSVGNINVDIMLYVRGLPEEDAEFEAEGFGIYQGGSAANFAVGISRLGIGCRMIGCVGMDPLGDLAVEELEKERVLTSGIMRCSLGTGIVVVLVGAGGLRRTMIAWRGANRLVPDALKNADLQGAKHIHLAGIPTHALREAILRKGGASISVDPGSAASEYGPEDLAGVDYLLLNEAEFRMLTRGSSASAEELEREVGCIIVKQGERGATLLRNGERRSFDAFKTTVADATGAGDAFDSGFIAGILNGAGQEEAVRWGSAAAAIKLWKRGAREGLPTREVLEEFLKTQRLEEK